MKPSRALLVVNLVALLLLLWIWGSDIVAHFQIQRSEVSAVIDPPVLWLAVVVVLLAIVFAGVVVFGVRAGRGPDFKGYRLLPILFLLAGFLTLFVLGESRSPFKPADQAAVALHIFSRAATELGGEGPVPADASQLDPLVKELGAPPYYVRGEPVPHYSLQIRQDCEGPIGDAPGARPGTILYCVARDRRVAWVTLVGLPFEEDYGEAEVFSRRGNVQVWSVGQAAEPSAEEQPDGGVANAVPEEEVPFESGPGR